jgi:hypothetical protein
MKTVRSNEVASQLFAHQSFLKTDSWDVFNFAHDICRNIDRIDEHPINAGLIE